jgi:hypothetical protein
VQNEAAVLVNRNAFDPTQWLYDPVAGQPGINKGRQYNNSLRVTWQATPKNKIAGTYKADKWCQCPGAITAIRTPEAAHDRRFPRLRQEHGEWTSPMTNRLLFEAVGLHLFERWGNMHLRVKGGSLEDERLAAVLPSLISVQEQTTGMTYRAWNQFNNTLVPNWSYRAAVSYVTGTHNAKVGFNRTHGFLKEYQYVLNPVSYRFNNGVPNQITMRSLPFTAESHQNNDLGLFVQDRWTMDRLTLNGAVRFDYFATGFPAQTIGPAALAPSRNISFPAADNLSWKDLTYRSGFSYDVRGDGKTAVKVAVNKYLLGQTLNQLGRDPNPVLSLATSTTRSWNDRGGLGINGDYVPQCDLLNPLANGECGPIDNRAFNTTLPGETYDKDLVSGFGNRMYNWEFSALVQHEVLPRVSADFGYFRRLWGNFRVTDNVLLGAEDFTQFSLTAPGDSRLPNGGGYTLTGLYNVKPEKFGQTQNFNTLSDKYGKQIEHWNGFDLNVNARLQNGVMFQGGLSSGQTTEDNCEVVAKLPEMLSLTGGNASGTTGAPAMLRPAQYCHRESPFLTQFKGYGVYTIPKVDVQIAGTFRSTPGTDINAGFVATNQYLAANSTLGRVLSGGQANITVGLLDPNTMYTERRNELDIRFGKVLRTGRYRSVVSLDFFNALNSDAIVNENQNFAAWLRPTEVLNARLMKFSVQFDF